MVILKEWTFNDLCADRQTLSKNEGCACFGRREGTHRRQEQATTLKDSGQEPTGKTRVVASNAPAVPVVVWFSDRLLRPPAATLDQCLGVRRAECAGSISAAFCHAYT